LSTLISIFFEICLLKKGPQALPHSRFFFQIILITYIMTNVVMLILFEDDLFYAVCAIVLDLLLVFGLLHVILMTANKIDRFMQTVIAVMGTNIIMSVGVMVAQFWYDLAETETAKELPGLLALVLFGWNIVVLGHIFRHALNTLFSIGILLSVGYILVQASFLNYLQTAFFEG
jgi:hypothetical protein